MKKSSVCDICKESPKSFECGPVSGDMDMRGMYLVVPADSNDPTTLLSSGEQAFKIWPLTEHPVLKLTTGELFICCSCFDKRFSHRADAESGEDWKHGK